MITKDLILPDERLPFLSRFSVFILGLTALIVVCIFFPQHMNALGIVFVLVGTILTLVDREQSPKPSDNLIAKVLRIVWSSNHKLGIVLISSGCLLNFVYDIVN